MAGAKKEEVKNEVAATTELAVQEEVSMELEAYDLSELGINQEELSELSGLESINASDIRVPYGKFWAVAKDGFEAGDIQLPDGTVVKGGKGEALKDLCILKWQTVRVMFPQPYKPSNSFICRSLNGKKGADDGEYAGTICSTCEFSKFPEEGGASPCREQILLLCTLPNVPMFHLLVSGMSVGEFKRSFLSIELMKGLPLSKKALKSKDGVLGSLNVNVTIGEEKTKDYGMKPVMQFRLDKAKPLVTIERLRANLNTYSSYKTFEQEAVETAATFAQTEQTSYEDQEAPGQNSDMF